MADEEMAVDPDPDDARAGTARLSRRAGLRRTMRRAGFVSQALLCAALAGWSAATGEVVYTVVAVVLLAGAVVLLARELRGRSTAPRSALPAGADLGEGAADDDPDNPEDRQ